MYGGPLPPGSLLGWILLGVTVVVSAARALRVETRAAGPRRARARVLDRALDAAVIAAVLALVAVLVGVVVDGMGGVA